ncbi:MAG TPA: cytochrome c [Gammaproteobacteria bacterium]
MTTTRSRLAWGAVLLAAACAAGTVAGAQGARDLERGKAVYERWCSHCHAPGPGHPGTQSLQVKYNGNLPAVLLERTDLTPDAVKVFVRQGVLSMAPFRKTEITDADLEDLAAYVARGGSGR